MPTKTRSKASKAPKNHARAKGQTQISFSIGEDLLEQIDQCAQADSRTRSNWVALKLMAAVEAEGR